MPSATIDMIFVLPATAASYGALYGDDSSGAASMPDTCSMDGLCHDPDEDCLLDVSLVLELTTAHILCAAPSPSLATKASDSMNSYATPPPELLGTTSTGFRMTDGWAWLPRATAHPSDPRILLMDTASFFATLTTCPIPGAVVATAWT
jgi:hypothetical protein